jgi:hypothetical protein
VTDLDTLGYPEHLYRLRGYISSLDDSVVQAAWVNRAQEILDELFAQHSALVVEHARTLERERDEALREGYNRGLKVQENALPRAHAAEAHAARYEKALRKIADTDSYCEDDRQAVVEMTSFARAALAWEDA